MIRFLIDEHLSQALADALLALGIDTARVQDVGLDGTPNPIVLDRVAAEGRAFVTLDRRTAPGFAYPQLAAGLLVAPVVIVDESRPFGEIATDLRTIAECETLDSLGDQVVVYLPLTK